MTTHEENLQLVRITLGRLRSVCRITKTKYLYYIMLFCDVLTFATFFICLPITDEARHYCSGFYAIFEILLMVY